MDHWLHTQPHSGFWWDLSVYPKHYLVSGFQAFNHLSVSTAYLFPISSLFEEEPCFGPLSLHKGA